MEKPRGELTRAQREIVETIWRSGRALTIGEVWQSATANREVARSTIQTLMERLEKRSWLVREEVQGAAAFRAACSHEEATGKTLSSFVQEHFDGSPSRLVMSLLGQGDVSPEELARIRKLLDEWEEE